MKLFDGRNFHQNPLIALLKGPDNQYEKLLIDEKKPINRPINNIHVRPLNTKEQRRLLKKQYRQLFKRHCQAIAGKDKSLRFTFPITYPCPMTSKKNDRSARETSSVISSVQQTESTLLPKNINPLKSAVSISFIDEKSDDMSKYKIAKENLSAARLDVPSQKEQIHRLRSSNAWIDKDFCQCCRSTLSNGICACIVQHVLRLNYLKPSRITI